MGAEQEGGKREAGQPQSGRVGYRGVNGAQLLSHQILRDAGTGVLHWRLAAREGLLPAAASPRLLQSQAGAVDRSDSLVCVSAGGKKRVCYELIASRDGCGRKGDTADR
jgi:hypothetical protein